MQRYFGLATDGIAGQDTYFVYGQGTGVHTTYGGPVFGSRTLSEGVSGGDVRIAQNRLNCFRYSQTTAAPADGLFGLRTGAAVVDFKSDAQANGQTGLAPDAQVGPGTFDALWIYAFAGGRAIFTGRNGFDVVFVQTVLQNLGLYGGPIDGYYGAGSGTAVRTFQSLNGITADGVVGPDTFYQFGLHNPVAAPKPLPTIAF